MFNKLFITAVIGCAVIAFLSQETSAADGSEWFAIRSKYSGLVLDIAREKHGANIITWKMHGRDNQLWTWKGNMIISKLGYALDIYGEIEDPGTKVIAWKSHGRKNQQWRMEGDNIISELNGLCLDIAGNSKKAGVGIIMWPLKSLETVDNQSWELIYQ